MKAAAIIYCLMPWIAFAFFRFAESLGATGQLSYSFLVTWVAISPVVTAMGLFVANTEGRRNG